MSEISALIDMCVSLFFLALVWRLARNESPLPAAIVLRRWRPSRRAPRP